MGLNFNIPKWKNLLCYVSLLSLLLSFFAVWKETTTDDLNNEIQNSPDICDQKFQEVQSLWQKHACYFELGVNETIESIESYVNRIYPQCFPKWRADKSTFLQTDLQRLLSLVETDAIHVNSNRFMQNRIQRLWPQWLSAISRYKGWIDGALQQFVGADSDSIIGQPRLYNRTKLHIHLHLGFLTLKPSMYFEERVRQGGPLGEIVQWTDLITGLYLLGHEVTVSKELDKTIRLIHNWNFSHTKCNDVPERPDLVYTDIHGYKQLKHALAFISKCKYRILDSFGTEAKYNLVTLSVYSGLKLNLQQFQTLFPHTPDNSFLGFVVEQFAATPSTKPHVSGKPIALVAGKLTKMWKDSEAYLRILSEFFDIHGNIMDAHDASLLPAFVSRHKVLSGPAYIKLLKSAKVLVGLGFPYESPAPLEAIANGVVFLNVEFKRPRSRNTTHFFHLKPTDRSITSQNPYIEEYVGEPYSYLVNPHDEAQVRSTIRRLLAHPINTGYIPFEFTPTGYLERLNALIEHQDFCSTFSLISDQKGLIPILAPIGQSCNQACESIEYPRHTPKASKLSITPILVDYLHQRNAYAQPKTRSTIWHRLRCAPEHFPLLNNRNQLVKLLNISCETVRMRNDLTAPHVDLRRNVCTLQNDRLYFSCSSTNQQVEHAANQQRLCPCRTRLSGQTSMSEHDL